MQTPIFAFQQNGNRVFKVGRVGFDSGTQDAGGAYTGVLKTEKISPAGEDGLAHFRRVALRVWRTGGMTVTMKAFVNGVQTKVYSGGVLVDQVFVATAAAPTSSPTESIVEMSIDAQGTYIEVEVSIVSTDITGIFLPESLEIHHQVLRPSRSRQTGVQS